MATKKTKKKKNSNVIKVISILLIVGAIGVLYKVLNQMMDMVALQKKAETVEQELEALKQENASLISTKEKLEDPDYIQTYARGEYMFSIGDEKIFYLPSSDTEE